MIDIMFITKHSMLAIDCPLAVTSPERTNHIPVKLKIRTATAIGHDGDSSFKIKNSEIAMPLIPPNMVAIETNIPVFLFLTEIRADIAINKTGKNSKPIIGPTRSAASAIRVGLKIGNAYKKTKTIVKAKPANNKTLAARRTATCESGEVTLPAR